MPIAYCSPRRGKIVRAEPSRGFEVFSYMLLESQDCAGGEVRVHREAGLRYITALADPQTRRLLREGTLQMSLFSEQVCRVEADGLRYLLRKNEDEEAQE